MGLRIPKIEQWVPPVSRVPTPVYEKTERLRELQLEKLRRKARTRIGAYTNYTYPNYINSAHQTEIDLHLEAVDRGDIDRLIVVMPPRHGKSLKVSERFPAWWMGRHPQGQIIHCSYGSDLVSGFGRKLRNLMDSPEHLHVFPHCRLSKDSRARDKWHTTSGGAYFAVGLGGAITGRGADILLIDDLLKGREAAESQTQRELAWNWYRSDAYTRLMPGGRIVIITTRWHEDDLVGRLLRKQEEGEGDEWVVLHHPAINAEGEALWPEFYPVKALERIRDAIGPRAWNSEYQGDPTPEEGTYFKVKDIHRGTPPPVSQMRIFGASDYAVTDDGGDYTAHMVIGVDQAERMWVLDLWHKQADTLTWTEALLGMMEEWKPIVWLEEKENIKRSVGPFITKEQRKRHIFVRREAYVSDKKKPVRARAIQGYISLYGLWIPNGSWWEGRLVKEMLDFPYGAHDDMVDTLSLAGRFMEVLRPQERDSLADQHPGGIIAPTLDELIGSR